MTFKRLLLCCRSSHSGVPELGLLAMQAFLQETAVSVQRRLASDGSEAAKAATAQFEWFMANFAGFLKEERRKGAAASLRRTWFRRSRELQPSSSAAETDKSKIKSSGVKSSSGDYINGSRQDIKRQKAAQVADLKVAIGGCGAFAKCLTSIEKFDTADVEDILAQMLACVCIFQKSTKQNAVRGPGAASEDDTTTTAMAAIAAGNSNNNNDTISDTASADPADEVESSLVGTRDSITMQLQLREGLRTNFLPVLLRACRDFIQQVSTVSEHRFCFAHSDSGSYVYVCVCDLQLPRKDIRPDILVRLVTICSTVVLMSVTFPNNVCLQRNNADRTRSLTIFRTSVFG